MIDAAGVTGRSKLRRVRVRLVDDDEGRIQLISPKSNLLFPTTVRTALEYVSCNDEITVSEIPGLDDNGQIAFARCLAQGLPAPELVRERRPLHHSPSFPDEWLPRAVPIDTKWG